MNTLTWDQDAKLHELIRANVVKDKDNPGFAIFENEYSTSRIAKEVTDVCPDVVCKTDSVTYRIRKELGLRIKKKVELKIVELPLTRLLPMPNASLEAKIDKIQSDISLFNERLFRVEDKIAENNKLFTGIARFHKIRILTEDPTLRHLFPDLWPSS